MPPLVNDQRLDARYGAGSYTGFTYTGNVGDDNAGVVRMRRIWDTWSTDYSRAPSQGVLNLLSGTPGFVEGPPLRRRFIRRIRRLPGALAGNSDPDPSRGSDESAYQVGDHQAGFYG